MEREDAGRTTSATAPVAAVSDTSSASVSDTSPTTIHSVGGEPAVRSRRRRTLALLFVIGLVIGLIAVAASGGLTPEEEEPPGELVAQLPLDPQGGDATFDNGAGKMTVPRGAVSTSQTVNVYKRVIPDRVRAVPPSGDQALVFPPGTLVTYVFSPATIRLKVPVTLTIRLPAGQRGLVFVTTAGQIRFLRGIGTGRNVTVVLRSFDLARPGAIAVRG